MLLHGNSKYVLLLLVIFRHENTDVFFWRGYILIENDAILSRSSVKKYVFKISWKYTAVIV